MARKSTLGNGNSGASMPSSRTGRHGLIAEILREQPVRSQGQLRELLAQRGVVVTQATVSRDLVELRASRVVGSDGKLAWQLPSALPHGEESPGPRSALARWCSEILITAERVFHQLVLRAPPGAAQLLAAGIDSAALDGVVGCVAGDDTVLVILRSEEQAQAALEELLGLAGS